MTVEKKCAMATKTMTPERREELATKRWRLLMRFGHGPFFDSQIRQELIVIDWEFVEAGFPIPN